jgi:cytochrome c peroxidase
MTYPDYFPEPHYQFTQNKLTKEGFELGRALFFDPVLSIDSSVSCASCHAQVHAFADHNTALSTGVFGRKGIRNSPAIINAAWQTSFMWDGGINHIEVMPFGPIDNVNEMNETLPHILKKLRRHPTYPDRFRHVFGETPVQSQQVFYVLAQYMGMLISSDARYDQMRRGEISFSATEERGYLLFRQHCASCHTEPLFTDHSFRNTGLPNTNGDTGRQQITSDPDDVYKFKVPTLRNVALTYPYMHDGSLRSLKSVLDHYSDGMIPYDNVDPVFKKENRTGIHLTQTEKEDIISFLHTLTDIHFVSRHDFSE